ncbi:MAG TPA: type II secretion system F family protein, partial [Dehalococcoidia bacterium]
YLSPQRDVTIQQGEDGEALLRRSASSIPAITRFLDARGYAVRWAFQLEQAGLTLRPGEYFLVRMMFALVTFAVVFVIGRNALTFVIALVAALVGFMLPAIWLRLRISRRINKINAQLVETITLIANAQRAGFAFAQGVDVAVKRMGPPISLELTRMLLDMNLGASTESALAGMNERIGSDDVDMVVTAILIQRQTGGNLAEVLESVTETMRDRERIQGEIKTLTSSQRMTGWVLSLWPAALGLLFFAINPSMMSLMWTTGAGIVLLVIWVVLNMMGIFTIRRILDIDI